MTAHPDVLAEMERQQMNEEQRRLMAEALQPARSRAACEEFDSYQFADEGDKLIVLPPNGKPYYGVRGKPGSCSDWRYRTGPVGASCKHLEMAILWREGLRPACMVAPCPKCDGPMASTCEYTEGRGYLIFNACEKCGEKRMII